MALTITNIGPFTSTSSGATLDVTGVTASVGDLVVLAVAADNNGASGVSSTSSSITDAAGNTWTQQSQVNRTPGGVAADGVTLTIWTCLVTSALSSASITVNFSPNTTAKAALARRVQPAAGEAVHVGSVGAGVSGNGTSFSTGTIAGIPSGWTVFGFCGLQARVAITGDSDTTNGSWTAISTAIADSGTVGTSIELAAQRKTVTGTGSQSWDTSFATAREYALNYLIVLPFSAALAATEAADAAAFTAGLELPATLAATEAADVAAFAAGLVLLPGDLAATEAPDVASFAADLELPATLAASEAPDRAAFRIGANWPDALPMPTLAGYGLASGAAVRRLAQEFGAARVYRRSRPLAEVSVSWVLDGWQQMLLDGFYRSVVEEGGQWFAVRLAFPSGLASVSARFTGKLAMQAVSRDVWRVTATLEVMDRPVMSEAALAALLDDADDPPAWPQDLLPLPAGDSWTLEPQPVLARSDDLPGLPQQRRRSRNGVTNAAPRWELSAEEAELFDGFFRWRGRDGAQWFDFPTWGGIGLVESKARFTGEADWTPRNGGEAGPTRWSVTAPIEIREREVVTAQEFAWLAGEDGAALFAAVAALHHVVNEEIIT